MDTVLSPDQRVYAFSLLASYPVALMHQYWLHLAHALKHYERHQEARSTADVGGPSSSTSSSFASSSSSSSSSASLTSTDVLSSSSSSQDSSGSQAYQHHDDRSHAHPIASHYHHHHHQHYPRPKSDLEREGLQSELEGRLGDSESFYTAFYDDVAESSASGSIPSSQPPHRNLNLSRLDEVSGSSDSEELTPGNFRPYDRLGSHSRCAVPSRSLSNRARSCPPTPRWNRYQDHRAVIADDTIVMLRRHAPFLCWIITNEMACHLFSPIVTLFIGYLGFGSAFLLHTIGITLTTYAVVSLGTGSRSSMNGFEFLKKPKNMAAAGMIMIFSHLALCHLFCIIYSYGNYVLDFSAPLMILAQRLSSFVWDAYDGMDDENVRLHGSQHQKDSAVKEIPSLVEFFGYAFFHGGFLVGPFIEFNAYRSMIKRYFEIQRDEEEMFFIQDRQKFLSRIGRGFSRFSQAVVCLSIFSLSRFMPLIYLTENAFVDELSIVQRIIYLHVAVELLRFKYYAVWTASEGSLLMLDLDPQRNSLANPHARSLPERPVARGVHKCVAIKELESASSMDQIIDSWNIGTRKWLKHYVYRRLQLWSPQHHFYHILGTFLISALWHGFYPGYLITFVTGSIATYISKYLSRLQSSVRSRLSIVTPELRERVDNIFYILGWGFTQMSINYIVVPFLLLTWRDGIAAWQSVHFYFHMIGLPILLVIGLLQRFEFVQVSPLIEMKNKEVTKESFSSSADSTGLGGRKEELWMKKET